MRHPLVVYGLLLISVATEAQDYRIFIDPSSRILVNGSTNVNQFTFKYTEKISIEKPVHVIRDNHKLKISGGLLDLKVKAFDSGNGLMNGDFRKMMNEPDNPFLQVELVTIIPFWRTEEQWIDGDVEIHIIINDISKLLTVKCKIENPESILIYGKQSLRLTEFGLVAPTRMMGMVKVRDVVDFDFALRFSTDR